MRIFLSLILLSMLFGLAACDDAGGTHLKEVPPPASQAAWVTAAEGGSVTLDDGARVDVPAGALTTDATVILERVTCDGYLRHPDFAGCLYEVRAESGAQESSARESGARESGATLTGRYTLTLPGPAGEVAAAGAEAQAGGCVLGDGAEGWRCQGDSAATDGGRVTATASRFGAFLHRLPLLEGSLSPTLVWDLPFSVCDGDLLGEWELVFVVAPKDALEVGSSSGGEDFSDCAPFEFLELWTVEYHERLSISSSVYPGAKYDYLRDRDFDVDRIRYFMPACLELHDYPCQNGCSMTDGVCRCFQNNSSGNGSQSNSLYEDAEGGLHFDSLVAPTLHTCVLGDTLAITYEDPSGPVLKVFRRK